MNGIASEKKYLSKGTIFLGFFWLVSALYWALTLILWPLGELGLVEKRGMVYGVLMLEGCLSVIACLELAILILSLLIYFIIREKSVQKKWGRITAIIVSFSYVPIVLLYGFLLLLLVYTVI